MRWLAKSAAVIFFAVGVAVSRLALEPEALKIGRIRDPAWLPEGKLLRTVCMGQRLIFSDFYWLRLVQYVGERTLTKSNQWDALYPLADLVTDLDPRYGYVYQIAGSNLTGLAGRFSEADRILQKGMKNVPDRWSLPFVYAVNKFLFEGEFDEAAEYARRAAKIGKRPYLALLAANLSLVSDEASEYEAAAAFLRESIAQSDQPELKQELQQRLVKVQTYQTLSRIEKALAAFKKQEGRWPRSLDEPAFRPFLPDLPADPSGGSILYDATSGEVRSSALGPRRPLRVER